MSARIYLFDANILFWHIYIVYYVCVYIKVTRWIFKGHPYNCLDENYSNHQGTVIAVVKIISPRIYERDLLLFQPSSRRSLSAEILFPTERIICADKISNIMNICIIMFNSCRYINCDGSACGSRHNVNFPERTIIYYGAAVSLLFTRGALCVSRRRLSCRTMLIRAWVRSLFHYYARRRQTRVLMVRAARKRGITPRRPLSPGGGPG